MRAAVLALLLAGTASAQEAPVWSPEAAANLKGFVRGLSADCKARCDASGGGQACSNGCMCFVAEVSHRLDPRTLEAGGKAEPSPDDIARFVADNAPAFEAAIGICGLPGR